MDIESVANKREILAALLRRKHERELQAAQLGVNADPIIRTEIADLERQIQQIQQELQLEVSHRESDNQKSITTEATAYNAMLARRGCSISVQIALLILLFFVPIPFSTGSPFDADNLSSALRSLRTRIGLAVMDYTWFYLLLALYAAVLLAYVFLLWYRRKR